MQATDLLGMQLRGSCDLVVSHTQSSADCWDRRAFAGTSRPGFIVWHCARIIDWGVHTVVRGVPEVAARAEWRDRVRYGVGHGVGITEAEADAVAATVSADDVAAYATELRDVITAWIAGAGDDELDRVPDLRAVNQQHPRYATPEAWQEVEGLAGIPAWQFLARPCVSHIRVHIGELETLCRAIAAGAGTPA